MAEQEERLGLVSLLHPGDAVAGDYVFGVLVFIHVEFFRLGADLAQLGVDILALARQDIPIVKAGWIRHQMPFSNDRRRIAGLLQQLGKRHLIAVKFAVGIVVKSIQMRILTGEN